MSNPDQFVDFGSGLSHSVKGAGWSFQEEGYTWTIGTASVINLPVAPCYEGGRLLLLAHPFTHRTLPHQRVAVMIKEQVVANFTMTEERILEIEIPAELAAGEDHLAVTLGLPDAVSPTISGVGNDDREIALAVKWVRWGSLRSEGDAVAPPQRRVLLVRKPQVAAISSIFNRLALLEDRLTVVACDIVIERVRDAVLGLPVGSLTAVWLQRTDDGPSPEAIAALVPGTPILTFPLLSMELLWPFAGHDPRRVGEPPLYPQGRYPNGDRIGAKVAIEDIETDEALYTRYLQLCDENLPSFPDALGHFVKLLSARDEGCTVKVGGFILSQFQHVRLFQNAYAPSGVLLRYLAGQLAIEGQALTAEETGPALIELDRLTAGYLGIWNEQVPVHPILAAEYHLRWYDSGYRYRWHDNAWTFKDYIVSYIRWAPWTV